MDVGDRRTLRAVAVITAVVLTSAARCPFTSSGDDGLRVLETALSGSRSVDDISRLTRASTVESADTGLSRAVAATSDDASGKTAAALQRARQTLPALAQVRAVQREADQALAGLPGDAAAVAQQSTQLRTAQQRLSQVGASLAKDVACSVTWDELGPDEQDDVRSAVGGGEVELSFAGEVTKATVEAVTNQAYVSLAGNLGQAAARAVEWRNYGIGIIKIGRQLAKAASTGDEPIVAPEWRTSRALVEYVRICLKPPSRG